MADSVPSSAALAKMLAKIVYNYLPLTADIESLFDTPAVMRTPAAARVKEARRRATQAAWNEGLSVWNQRAKLQLEFLDAVGPQSEQLGVALALCSADFGGLAIDREWDAGGRLFAAPLILAESRILGPARLDGARLMAGVDARGLQVERDLTADQAEFVGKADFSGLSVGASARFAYATFLSDASFAAADVTGWFWFRNARMDGTLNFVEARVGSDASFGACRYGGAADFRGAMFLDTVSFEGATFEAALDLSGASFSKRVWLTGLDVHGDFFIEGTQFRSDVEPPLDSFEPPPKRRKTGDEPSSTKAGLST